MKSLLITCAVGLAVANPVVTRATPSKEELCIGYNNDFDKCQKTVRTCGEELQAAKQELHWDNIAKCVASRRPQKTATATGKATTTSAQPTANVPENDGTGKRPVSSITADIRVDTNRDGVVDVDGDTDTGGKDNWTEASGAIFLANIGDKSGRCKQLTSSQGPQVDIALAQCHDADSDQQRAPEYMAPMRTMPIKGLSQSATGTVSVADAKVRAKVRIFHARGDKWEIVDDQASFSSEELSNGLTLGIDARDVRRPDWDGKVSVDFTVKDGDATAKDTVMLRVAPVLIHHHGQPIEKMFASSFPGIPQHTGAYIKRIHDDVENSMRAAQVPGPQQKLATLDPWSQDVFEPGYMSMPGPNGSATVMRVNLEGRRNNRHAIRLLYTDLRGDGVGAVLAMPRANQNAADDTLQAGGNIEAIPPYEHNGQRFPVGRVMVGSSGGSAPRAVEFFRAQGMQDPIVLDSSWTMVQHIDEMLQFVPAQTARGWVVLAIDPQMGLVLLREAQRRGFGKEPFFSREKVPGSFSIDDFLALQSNIDAAERASQIMTANLDRLKNETGITDGDIFRLPALVGLAAETGKWVNPYTAKQRRSTATAGTNGTDADLAAEFLQTIDMHGPGGDSAGTGVQKRQAAGLYNSWLPSLVNGVPLTASRYLAPKPLGPVLDGRDIFETAAALQYKKAGIANVDFVDEWLFHASSGDLHCMTNTYRDASKPWW